MNPSLLKGELEAMWIMGRLDSTHTEFSVVARYKLAGRIRRLFDWLLTPAVRVTIHFESAPLPCSDCYIGLEDDLSDLFGPDAIQTDSIDYQEGLDPNLPIELEIFDPGRRFMNTGKDFYAIVETVRLAVIECQSGHHHVLDVA